MKNKNNKKRQFIKILACLILLVNTVGIMPPTIYAFTAEEQKGRKTLIIGTELDYSPSNLKITAPPLKPSKYCYAVRETRKYEKIEDKLVSILKPSGIPGRLMLRYITIFFALLLISGLFLWPQLLRREVAKRTKELKREIAEHKHAKEELRAVNQQLRASEQQLRAANQQLKANEQQLRAEIKERKKVEEMLLKSKEFIETVFNSVNDSITVLDATNFKIIRANRIFLNMFGVEEKDIIGKTCYEVTHNRSTPCEPPDDICPLVETLKTGEYSFAEHRHRDKDGKDMYFEISTSPIKNKSGQTYQIVHLTHDITKRRKMEEELKKKIYELERFHKIVVGRELKMKELKKRIKELEEELKH